MIQFDYSEDYDAKQFQGLLKSTNKTEYIPTFNVWAFPDAAKFGANLFDINANINDSMEEYALEVMLAFCPIRTAQDLELDGSYVHKF